MMLEKIAEKIKAPLIAGALGYFMWTGTEFFAISREIREEGNRLQLTTEQKITLNSNNIDNYNSSPLLDKTLNFGGYLAYKLYQTGLSEGYWSGGK